MKKRLPACQTDGMMTHRHYEGADSCSNFLNRQWVGQFFILAASWNFFYATGTGRPKCSIAEAALDIAACKAQKCLTDADVLSLSLYGGKYLKDVLFHIRSVLGVCHAGARRLPDTDGGKMHGVVAKYFTLL